jgi:selenide,water dikinase
MIRGFNDHAKLAHTRVTGGQTVLNPWPIIGGIALSVCSDQELIRPVHAQPGAVLVLTKPLGTQLAVNGHQWLHQPNVWPEKHRASNVSEAEVLRAYNLACRSMARLNLTGARLMHVHKAQCATDVTGFGVTVPFFFRLFVCLFLIVVVKILGHLRNLAQNQTRHDLLFRLTSLPVLRGMMELDAIKPDVFKLAKGLSAETSGGLLIALPSRSAAEEFLKDYRREEHCEDGWIVGTVELATAHQTVSDGELDANYAVTLV